MEDTSGFEETPSGPAAAMEAVKKFGIGKLLLIVILLAAAMWFFVLSPKPGSVTVNIHELDSDNPMDSVEVDLGASGQKTVTKFTSASGTVSFDNVPSQTDVSLDILPPSTHRIYGSAETSFQLKSQQSKSVDVTLAQNANLKITLPSNKVSLGTDCNTNLDVTVQNTGDQPASVQLLGDGGLKGLIQANAITLPPQSSKTLAVNVTAPGKKSQISGKIRAQFTAAGDPLTLDATTPDELRIDPSQFSDHMPPSTPYSIQFTIENAANEGEAHLLTPVITGDFLQYGTTATYADQAPLKAGAKKILTLQFTPPPTTGISHGVMIIASACQSIQVPLQATVESR